MSPSPPAPLRDLRLAPHPEGGAYREVFRSRATVVTPRGPRPSATAILFLLAAGEFSRWHAVANPEWWHLLDGDSVELTWLGADLAECHRRVLGPGDPPCLVPAGCWQTALSLGQESLVGCTVSPGFDFADFTLLRDSPAATEVTRRHPHLASRL